jgi:predicted RNA-binding Zn-ribbon protein involved in translation (DUF1610 family)
MRIFIPRNETEYLRQYGSEEACQRRAFELRRASYFDCPHCRNQTWREMKRVAAGGRPATWHRVCKKCGWQERPLAGTWLHGLRIRLQDFCKICWLAAGAGQGFDVRWLRSPAARRLVLDLGSNRTYYRSVKLVRAIMEGSLPMLEGKLELCLIMVAHPNARAASHKLVVVLVEAGGRKRVRVGILSDEQPATVQKWLASVTVDGASVRKNSGQQPDAEKIASRLQSWLAKVGWEVIDSRNLPDYLMEFSWRHNGHGTQGSRMVQLLRAALTSVRPTNPEAMESWRLFRLAPSHIQP